MSRVTREEAIKFFEGACRNWSKVPKLSEDDIGDVASELLRFSLAARAEENEACAVTAEKVGIPMVMHRPLLRVEMVPVEIATAIRSRTTP